MSDRRISMFLAHDNGLGYIQIVVKLEDSERLKDFGFVRSIDDLNNKDLDIPDSNDDISAHITTNPDKGDGVPGTIQWYANMISGMKDKTEIESYVKELTGVDIDKRGKLVTIQSKAIKVVEEWLQPKSS